MTRHIPQGTIYGWPKYDHRLLMYSDPGGQTAQSGSAADSAEKGRRRIVSLIFIYYLLLIFEGALRKWVLTSYGQLLFFIRDPFVLTIYWLAWRHSFFPRGNAVLTTGIVFAFTGLLMVAVQAAGVASGIDKWPILAVYGWRNYFLYLPLPFVVARAVREVDLQRIAKLALLLTLPIAALVLLQFRSPLDAPINVGFGASAAEQFHGLAVDKEHTRPMGTFTSDVGQKEFIVTTLAALLALWISPSGLRFVKPWQLILATCGLLTCLAVSGSRGAMLASAVVVCAAIASGAVAGQSGASARAVLLPAILVGVAALLYPIVFPEGYATFMNRWTQASITEAQTFHGGVFGRAFYSFYDFTGLLGDTPLAGYGMGLAGNASITLGVVIPGFHGWAESDWARHIVELGPIVGVGFIVYRIALVIWLGGTCAAAARRNGNPLALLLFASCGIDLLYGQLTGHGSVNGFAWLFAGLSLAAAQSRTETLADSSPVSRAPDAQPLFPNLMR